MYVCMCPCAYIMCKTVSFTKGMKWALSNRSGVLVCARLDSTLMYVCMYVCMYPSYVCMYVSLHNVYSKPLRSTKEIKWSLSSGSSVFVCV